MITPKYKTCPYCGKRTCNGCKLPFNDELFANYVKYDPSNE